jgi:hypothetical protein
MTTPASATNAETGTASSAALAVARYGTTVPQSKVTMPP